jgi:branched-chain amino acid transport system ATP-binding protein
VDQGQTQKDQACGCDTRRGSKRGGTVKPVLSVHGLDKRFGAVVAADALSIDIAAGQRVSLIGANGAGKTTFVNMVTGYLKPDSGSILLDGMDIAKRSPRNVARLGISRSFQIPQLFVDLTAAENLAVAFSGMHAQALSFHSPAQAQGRRDKAIELLARFGLAEVADRPIFELAGGVRKLIDIAMALVRRPKLLLLDEPTSGVSAEEKFATMDRVIHAVAPDAATIVFVEHDMEIVSRYADRVVAFYQGRILADGDPRDVLKEPEVRRYVTGGAA